MTTMTGTGTCTANYTEYFRNLAYCSGGLLKPIICVHTGYETFEFKSAIIVLLINNRY